jgi:hypothetical protein
VQTNDGCMSVLISLDNWDKLKTFMVELQEMVAVGSEKLKFMWYIVSHNEALP